jgi:hypothetical protein
VLAATLAVAAVAPVATPAAAQGQDQIEEVSLDGVDRTFVPALADPDRTVSVVVEMAGEPVAVEQGQALDAGDELSAGEETQVQEDLEVAQDAILPEIRELGSSRRSGDTWGSPARASRSGSSTAGSTTTTPTSVGPASPPTTPTTTPR